MAEPRRVVVVGAGYAGLNAALRLADRARESGGFEATLVDQRPYHLVKVRLHEAAARETDVTVPLLQPLEDTGLRFHQAAVTGFDFGGKRVLTSTGPLDYDYLLLALGSVTNFFKVPGLAEKALALDSLDDSVRIRARAMEQVVLAAEASDAIDRERRLRFVIGGAGFTAVELAGELAEVLPALCERVGLPRDAAKVVVVDGHDRILPTLDEDGSAYAASELGKKGVEFRLGVHVTALDDRGATLTGGELLPTATVVWAGGILANPLIAASGLKTGQQGRLALDTMLRVPERAEVFAAGDCALALDPSRIQPVPAQAQLALQEGRHAAENIVHSLRGEPLVPFDPDTRGEVVSLGHDRAVGWVRTLADRNIKVRGLIGDVAKRFGEAEWELHLWRETHHLDEILG
jgi:NADH dehydrogenase